LPEGIAGDAAAAATQCRDARTYIYQFATRGSFEEGSLAALIIVAIGILPVIRLTRHADMTMIAGSGRNQHVRASSASPRAQ
jgi:hypothetical protein